MIDKPAGLEQRRITPGTEHSDHPAVSNSRTSCPTSCRLSASDSARPLRSQGAWRENASEMELSNCDGGVLTDDVHPGAGRDIVDPCLDFNPKSATFFHRRRVGCSGRTGLCGCCADRTRIRDRKELLWSLSRRSAKRERAPILNRRPSATCRAGICSADQQEDPESTIVGHEGVEMPQFQVQPCL